MTSSSEHVDNDFLVRAVVKGGNLPHQVFGVATVAEVDETENSWKEWNVSFPHIAPNTSLSPVQVMSRPMYHTDYRTGESKAHFR